VSFVSGDHDTRCESRCEDLKYKRKKVVVVGGFERRDVGVVVRMGGGVGSAWRVALDIPGMRDERDERRETRRENVGDAELSVRRVDAETVGVTQLPTPRLL
jgi:hypothetical protein